MASGGQTMMTQGTYQKLLEDADYELLAEEMACVPYCRGAELKGVAEKVTLYSVVPQELSGRRFKAVEGAEMVVRSPLPAGGELNQSTTVSTAETGSTDPITVNDSYHFTLARQRRFMEDVLRHFPSSVKQDDVVSDLCLKYHLVESAEVCCRMRYSRKLRLLLVFMCDVIASPQNPNGSAVDDHVRRISSVAHPSAATNATSNTTHSVSGAVGGDTGSNKNTPGMEALPFHQRRMMRGGTLFHARHRASGFGGASAVLRGHSRDVSIVDDGTGGYIPQLPDRHPNTSQNRSEGGEGDHSGDTAFPGNRHGIPSAPFSRPVVVSDMAPTTADPFAASELKSQRQGSPVDRAKPLSVVNPFFMGT